VRALKWGDVYQGLEEATDKAEHAGIAIESIFIKRADAGRLRRDGQLLVARNSA
jgi:hypothetical protein